jgi:predicted Fe-Mo cluster-binding NifX family protein
MRIAIPTFGTRVSPRFDCAETLLLVTVDEDRPTDRSEVDASGWAPHDRINRIVEFGADTVICGGIDRWSMESLQAVEITVIDDVVGAVDIALAALLSGSLKSQLAEGVGGTCRHRQHEDATVTADGVGYGAGATHRRRNRPRGTGRHGAGR